MTSILLTTFAVTLVLMVALWLVSLPLADVSIVDIFWSLGFVVAAWASYLLADAPSSRSWLVLALVSIWGVRLSAHLAARSVGRGEDFRYRAMREAHGARFPIVSLGTVFLLQGVLLWIISLPLQVVPLTGTDRPLGALDAVGVLLWSAGFAFEAVADAQLARFKRQPSSRGAVLDTGLWRYSRHPNYFGDCLVWWGLGAIGAATGAWWTLVGPVVMTVLLLRVSGVTLLESTITERRPAYRDYIARTSAFVPWLPRQGR